MSVQAYLSPQPVGEVLVNGSKGLNQGQNVLVREFTGGQSTDVDHLTGTTLEEGHTLVTWELG